MKSEKASACLEKCAIQSKDPYVGRYVLYHEAAICMDIAEEETEKRVREELTRWHDPKEKLPPPRQVALLKLKDADDEVYYRVGIFLDCRQFQFIGYRLGSEVLGWQYIHE